jgi:hypothetical protein
MSRDTLPPDFPTFTRWLAETRLRASSETAQATIYDTLLKAARIARDEMLRATSWGSHRFETLTLLAAATEGDTARPPELTTARGFRVTLVYDDGENPGESSICVLVQCPDGMISQVQGEVAYLWNGSQRFELGQFDADGKALGTLPAGVQISLSDFSQGNVKLEEPPEKND